MLIHFSVIPQALVVLCLIVVGSDCRPQFNKFNVSKIDVHHHAFPSIYFDAIVKDGGDLADFHFPEWSVEITQANSAAAGAKTAILSLTTPGVDVMSTPQKAAGLARSLNSYFAGLRKQYPEGFGFFGTLPSLLNTQLCLEEINYMFDELNADGITLFTRYGEGHQYLGHADFEPIWKELNRRKAVVFVHPGPPPDTNLISGVPQFAIEYTQETTRAALDLIVNNRISQYPDCKIILSHAGGTLPYIISRPAGTLPDMMKNLSKTTEEILEEARTFYFDTALSGNEVTLKALLAFAKPGHVLFGTDIGAATDSMVKYYTDNLNAFEMDPVTRELIDHKAAMELIPRLRK